MVINLKTFHYDQEQSKDIPSPFIFDIILDIQANAVRQEKETEVLESINDYCKMSGHNVNIQKSIA